jgi:hypothetical protein
VAYDCPGSAHIRGECNGEKHHCPKQQDQKINKKPERQANVIINNLVAFPCTIQTKYICQTAAGSLCPFDSLAQTGEANSTLKKCSK